jgi:mycoredoxin
MHMAEAEASPSPDPSATDGITVYWRPGCPFCASLRHGLRRSGVTYREVNIWNDHDAAAFVRSVANGNETVPTVAVGSTTLVNPSARQVLAAAEVELPGLITSRTTSDTRSRRRWFGFRSGAAAR